MLDFVKLQGLLDSETEETWLKYLYELSDDLGFNQVLYGITEDRRLPLLGNIIVKSNYSLKWDSFPKKQTMVSASQAVSHALTKCTPVVWDSVTYDLSKQQELFEEASGLKIKSGITYPMHGCNYEWGILSFSSDRPNFEISEALPHLSLLKDFAYQSGKKFFRKKIPIAP